MQCPHQNKRRIHVGFFAEATKIAIGIRYQFLKNQRSLPMNIEEGCPVIRFSVHSDQIHAAVGSRAEQEGGRVQSFGGGEQILRRERRAIVANGNDALKPLRKHLFERIGQPLPEVVAVLLVFRNQKNGQPRAPCHAMAVANQMPRHGPMRGVSLVRQGFGNSLCGSRAAEE